MADILGKRLLLEVEEVGVGDILDALRLGEQSLEPASTFAFPPLDRLLQAATEGRAHHTKTQTVLELTPLHAGGGATTLLYYLTALAVLPHDCRGRQHVAIIFDTDGHWVIERLIASMRFHIQQHVTDCEPELVNDIVAQSLRHVHIFRPQSLTSVTATLEALPAYLFDQQRHFSLDRAVAFVAMDSASAFYWQDRAETEDATFFAKTSGSADPAPPSGYLALTAALKAACSALKCSAIITSWSLASVPTTTQGTRALRPSLPPPLATLPSLRMLCRRLPVTRFPPLIDVEGALIEAGDRLAAVEEGKFECFINERGWDERTLGRLHSAKSGFEFKMQAGGLVFEGQP